MCSDGMFLYCHPADNPGLCHIRVAHVDFALLLISAPCVHHSSTCLPHGRMPAPRLLCPVIELTPLPPAVRALYAPPPAQSRHRTVSTASTRPAHRSPRASSVKNAAARPRPASSHPSTPVPRNAKGHPQKTTTTTIYGVTASSSISCRAGSPCVNPTTPESSHAKHNVHSAGGVSSRPIMAVCRPVRKRRFSSRSARKTWLHLEALTLPSRC